MRGTTFAAVATCTLLAISGCATPGDTTGTAATAAPAVTISGLDEATANACGLANHATLGEAGYDLDVATAKQIITVGKTSKSTSVTSAVNVLELNVRQAEAAVGNPDEASRIAEVRTSMLKFQTLCQNVDALVTSIQESQRALDSETGEGPRG